MACCPLFSRKTQAALASSEREGQELGGFGHSVAGFQLALAAVVVAGPGVAGHDDVLQDDLGESSEDEGQWVELISEVLHAPAVGC